MGCVHLVLSSDRVNGPLPMCFIFYCPVLVCLYLNDKSRHLGTRLLCCLFAFVWLIVIVTGNHFKCSTLNHVIVHCYSKQMAELESEKRYLSKSNMHLENILEATNTCKKQEVSQLNRIHVDTIKVRMWKSLAQVSLNQLYYFQ